MWITGDTGARDEAVDASSGGRYFAQPLTRKHAWARLPRGG
jgi:hypothetical protein